MPNSKDVKKPPAKPTSKDEKAPGDKKNFMDDINKGLRDLVGKMFGDSGTKFYDDAKDKMEEFSNQTAKKLFEFADSALDSLKLRRHGIRSKTYSRRRASSRKSPMRNFSKPILF